MILNPLHSSTPSVGHTLLAKLVHWTFIPLYVYGIFKQVGDISELEDSDLLLTESLFALVFIFIVLTRFFYMRRFDTMHASRVPVHRVHKIIARTVHISIYVSLILLPLSGLAIAFLFHQGIKDGIFQDTAIGIHEFSALLSYIVIAIHVSAAIYSRIKGEGVWSSMVPILNQEAPSNNPIVVKINSIEERMYDEIEKLLKINQSN